MRLPSVPGPSDVLSAVSGLRDGVGDAVALVPRVAAAVGSMEQLLGRVTDLLDRVDGVVDRADAEITRLEDTRTAAERAIAAVGDTQAKAAEAIAGVTRIQAKANDAIDAVGLTTTRAGGTLDEASDLVGRMGPLLSTYEPALTGLAPSVHRLAETLEPAEVEAMVTLIDRLPQLVGHLDEDILPVLQSLDNVGTDVHDLVDMVQDLRQLVKGFPGSRLFRRRGAEEIAEERAEDTRGQTGT